MFARGNQGEDNGNSLQYSCLENPMEGGTQQAAVHGVTKSRTQLSDFTFIFHFHALEKEMATHSSVLTWRIPGTAETGRLLSMGSHRVGQRQQQQHVKLRFYTLHLNDFIVCQLCVFEFLLSISQSGIFSHFLFIEINTLIGHSFNLLLSLLFYINSQR